MKKIVALASFAFLLVALSACNKPELLQEAPPCIQKKINQALNKPVQNPGMKVWKWTDASNTYYYVTSDCCDQFNYLYDDKCNIVCAPDGGFSGGGDGNCPNFQGTLVKTLVWEDPR
jgi:hypothetical protein